MAQFNTYPTQDLMKQLNKLENIDKVSKDMVKEAIPIVVKESQEKIMNITSPDATGQTMNSLMPRGVRVNSKTGVVSDKAIFYGFDGRGRAARHMRNYQKRHPSFKTILPDGSVDQEGGTPYNLKAAILEHGSIYHKKRPFVEKVVEDCGENVANKMQAVFNKEMET